VVEAYRHLVETVLDAEMPPRLVGPRRLLTCHVAVRNVLDLRTREGWEAVGLTEDLLRSDVGDYEACQAVASAAHQLELHGIVASAATGLGETLALFERHLTPAEIPVLTGETIWEQLPADPRKLSIVQDSTDVPRHR
jgi:hypothetical protein